MNNSAALLRTLITYAICVPLAIIVGWWAVSLANAPTYSNFAIFGVLALVFCVPILLRWHHPLMILCWNLPIIVFFLPGRPGVFLPMMVMSLGISVLQRTLNKNMRFIPAMPIALPLLLLAGVVLVTMKLTGGIGLHSLGSSIGGGRKYVYLMAGILGFFAITARRIPPRQAGLYVAFFLLAPCLSAVGDLIAIIPSSFYFIFLIFPPDFNAYAGWAVVTRFGGVAIMSVAVFKYMLARYGVGGIFRSGRPWRLALLLLFSMLAFFGGFRSMLLDMALLFFVLFLVEGLHRTKLLPILAFAGLLGFVICIPMADRLPDTFQRVLSILPVKINPVVRGDAQASLDWRIQMWQALLPEVPRHLLLGKGYVITQEDYEMLGRNTAFHAINPAQQGLALAGDYHSGPLSVILPFGIWGVITFTWFLIAGVWVLRRNRLYGDPALRHYNNALFALFVSRIISFVFVFGALSGDILAFSGILGLSIAMNGGICRPVRQSAATLADAPKRRLPERPRLQPAFPR